MKELGWLIETQKQTYWDGQGIGKSSFRESPNDAIRFARFQDAEVVRCQLLGHLESLRSIEHQWGI